MRVLQEITLGFCCNYSIPTKVFQIEYEDFELPVNPFNPSFGFALVPKDVLRELPVAADWSDIDRVVRHNEALRQKINKLIVNIAEATVREKKKALRDILFGDPKTFDQIFQGFLSGDPTGYDFVKDRKSIEALRQVLASTSQRFPLAISVPSEKTSAELRRIVDQIVEQFKRLIENNDLSRLLWDGSRPKSEKAAQLVFFGIAESYCRANNIDISPEVHSGGGPVDFKFSTGYEGRLLIEIKLSKGKVVQGYETQVDVYKEAANTSEAIFLVINVGEMGDKIRRIEKIRNERQARGERATDIVVVDATRKPSASKRRGDEGSENLELF